jgi:hypothetical protein
MQAGFGSYGDQQMLEYTASGPGQHLMLILHHDDDAREVASTIANPISANWIRRGTKPFSGIGSWSV